MRKGFIVSIALLASAICSQASDTEVRVRNPEAGITLAGTLTTPVGKPKAVLVLATGSGQQNRDEELMGRRPFKTIADGLAERGYATLRMDDRGAGESEGDFAKAVNDDFVSDIAAGMAYVDSIFADVAIGVLGHSEGGTTAIKEAVRDPRCRFIVTLAAPAWPGDSIVMSQARALAVGLTGTWEKEAYQRRLLDIAGGPLPQSIAQAMLYQELVASAGEEAAKLPQVQQQLNATAALMCSPHYRDFLRYDPSSDIAAVKVPWLALNGERDTQVLAGNLDTIKDLNPAADTMLMPGHNHLFQPCTTGLVNEYTTISGDISDETIAAIAAWLDKNIAI